MFKSAPKQMPSKLTVKSQKTLILLKGKTINQNNKTGHDYNTK